MKNAFFVTENMNKPKCIFTKRGRYEYGGSQNTTCSGRQCRAWGESDEYGEYEKNEFPLDVGVNVAELESCRNPDLRSMGDWCWDEHGWTKENCCIPPCAGKHSTRAS